MAKHLGARWQVLHSQRIRLDKLLARVTRRRCYPCLPATSSGFFPARRGGGFTMACFVRMRRPRVPQTQRTPSVPKRRSLWPRAGTQQDQELMQNRRSNCQLRYVEPSPERLLPRARLGEYRVQIKTNSNGAANILLLYQFSSI